MKCAELITPLQKVEFEKTVKVIGKKRANIAFVENNNHPLNKTADGNTSSLYKKISDKLGENKAIELKAKTFSAEFKSLYGNWTDIQTEPTLKDNFVFEGLFADIPIIDMSINNKIASVDRLAPSTKTAISTLPSYHQTVATRLYDSFAKHGVDVNIIVDEKLIDSGVVETINGKVTVTINPLFMTHDTLFHEFAHIYIDMIKDTGYINYAIDQLRNTELWDKVASINGTLSPHLLGKEVLATAIGLEAEQLFKDEKNIAKWKFILNSIFAKIAKVLGIKRNEARELAKDLVSQNLMHTIDRSVTIVKQHQHIGVISSNLKPYREMLVETRNNIDTINKAFNNNVNILEYEVTINDTYKTLNNYIKSEESLNILNLIENVNATTQYVTTNISEVSKELTTLYNKYGSRNFTFKNITPEEFNEYNDILRIARNMFSSFEPLINFSANTISITESNFPNIKERAALNELNSILDKLINGSNSNDRLSLTAMIEDAKLIYDALETKGIAYTMSLTTDPKFNANSKEQDFIREFNENLIDEGVAAYIFNSGYDSRNKFVALSVKYMRLTYGKKDLETAERLRTFNHKFAAFNKNRMHEIIQDGRLVQEYNLDSFYAAVEEQFKNDKAKVKKTKSEIIDQLTYNPQQQQGELSSEAINRRISEEEAKLTNNEITKQDFIRWRKDNFTIINGKLRPKFLGEFKHPIKSHTVNAKTYEFNNKQYSRIQNDVQLKTFYDYLDKELKYLTNHIYSSPQRLGFLPAVSKVAVKAQEKLDATLFENQDIDGNMIRTLPFQFLGYLNAKHRYKIDYKQKSESKEEYEKRALNNVNTTYVTNFKTLDEVRKYNKDVGENNRKHHKDNLNQDLSFTMPLFIEAALTNKYKHTIESTVLNNLNSIKYANVNKTGKTVDDNIKQANKLDYKGKIKNAIIPDAKSFAYLHLQNIIEMDFYDNFSNKPHNQYSKAFNSLVDTVKFYSSVKGMGFNIHAAVKNVTYGKIMTIIESAAGRNLSPIDLLKAETNYFGNLHNFYGDSRRNTITNKYSGIIDQFNVIEDMGDLLERQDPTLKGGQLKKALKKSLDYAYMMQSSGEHMMHNVMLFAMLQSHRVINGSIMSFDDFTRGDLTEITDKHDLKESKAIAAENTSILKDRRTAFEQYKTVDESIELAIDANGMNLGYTKFTDDSGISDSEFIFFKEKIKGVNHKLHGIYNKIDKGYLEHFSVFRAIMQFHHWMPAGVTKRFAGLGDALRGEKGTSWNERRQEEAIGDYSVVVKIISQAIKRKLNDRSPDHNAVVNGLLAVWHVSSTILTAAYQIKINYHRLNLAEKAGAKRTMMELGILTSLILLQGAIYDPDDDEKRPADTWEQMWYDFWANQLNASIQELSVWIYPPAEYKKIMNSPAAPERAIGDMYNTMISILKYPFQTKRQREFQSGNHKGQVEAVHNLTKLIPFVTQLHRWQDLDKNSYQFHIRRPVWADKKLPYAKKKSTKKVTSGKAVTKGKATKGKAIKKGKVIKQGKAK